MQSIPNQIKHTADKQEISNPNIQNIDKISNEIAKYKFGEPNQDNQIISKIMSNRGINIPNAENDPYDKAYDLRRMILQK